MAISKSFLLLVLTFAVVLFIASEASARDLLATETGQTKENANANVDGYHKGYGHGDYKHYGHHGHYGHYGHGKGHHGHHGHGKEHHGHYGHGKEHHGHYGHHGHKGYGGYSYHSAAVGVNAGN